MSVETVIALIVLGLATCLVLASYVMSRFVERPSCKGARARHWSDRVFEVDDPEQNERVVVITSPRLARMLKRLQASEPADGSAQRGDGRDA